MPRIILTVALLAAMLPCAGSAQDNPGPAWSRMVRLSDGRTLVTDGAMMIDAAVAKPAALPDVALPPETARTVEGWLSVQWPDEVGLAQLSPRDGSRTYAAPSGVVLGATYVDFLRRALPPAQVRLRMRGDNEHVVILSGGKPIGVVMPVKR